MEKTLDTPHLSPSLDASVRRAETILAEGEKLLGAWEEEKREHLQELQKEFTKTYSGRKDFDQLIEKNNKIRMLIDDAYASGRGLKGKPPLSDLLSKAKKLNLPWVLNKIKKNHKKGMIVAERRKNEEQDKASGKPLSTVTPRPNSAKPVTLPDVSPGNTKLPEAPAGLHPNDIRALTPASSWTLLMDETGSDFGEKSTSTITEGKFVGLLVNSISPKLLPLKNGFHAVDCTSQKQIDKVVQAVLDAPCGIIGLPLKSLPQTRGQRWLDGMLAVVEWVLRLLPINGPTTIDVAIEGRAPFFPKIEADTVARNALKRLGRAWPDRAALIDLKIRTIGKNDHVFNGYVDALAYTWGSPTASSRERLKRTKLLGTCFMTFDAHDMSSFWDTWDRPGGISPTEWTKLLSSPDAQKQESIAWALLFNLAVACVKNQARLFPFMEETRSHLESKAVNLLQLGWQIDWLQAIVQNVRSLSPSMRLVWLTAKLAQANHIGTLEQEWMEELEELGSMLHEEDAPLVCHADLHMAVNATNRFDFDLAEKKLLPWLDCDPAVPGLRYWSQVQSSMGQVKAFQGRDKEAVAYFDKALQGFARLSERQIEDSESSQTLCYAVISAMDCTEVSEALSKRLLQNYLELVGLSGDVEKSAEQLADDTSDLFKYAHHVFLRWLILRGNDVVTSAYLARQDHWDAGNGHPWPLIQLYRGLLLKAEDEKKAMHYVMNGAALAFMADQGPTVNLIGVCCRGVTTAWGMPWEEAATTLDELRSALPLAVSRIDRLASWIENPNTSPIKMIQDVLPFNFR